MKILEVSLEVWKGLEKEGRKALGDFFLKGILSSRVTRVGGPPAFWVSCSTLPSKLLYISDFSWVQVFDH